MKRQCAVPGCITLLSERNPYDRCYAHETQQTQLDNSYFSADGLLSVRGIALYLDCDRSYVYKLEKQGRLPSPDETRIVRGERGFPKRRYWKLETIVAWARTRSVAS